MSYLGWLPQEVGEVGYDHTKQASLGHVQLESDRILELGGVQRLASSTSLPMRELFHSIPNFLLCLNPFKQGEFISWLGKLHACFQF